MSDKHIGIIIQNQDKKILFYDDTCYIKVRINEDDDINKIIASKVKETVDMNSFYLLKTFVFTPYSKLVDLNIISDEEMTMYLVEVCIYHNEYDFIKIDELLDVISDHSEQDFFKKNFVDYMMYKNASQSFIINNVLTICNLFIYFGYPIEFTESVLISLLLLISSFYFIICKFIAPIFAKYLVKSKISIDTMNKLNYLSCFLLIFVLIKTYLL